MSQSSRLWPVWSRWISTYKLCFKYLFPLTILVENKRNWVLRCYVMAVTMLNTVMFLSSKDHNRFVENEDKVVLILLAYHKC